MTDSSNVVKFTGLTRLNLDPGSVLDEAASAGLTQVVILGFDADGGEYIASSIADGGDVLWHLARAQHRLMMATDRMVDGE